jgi:TrmH family RNA methyltransferase
MQHINGIKDEAFRAAQLLLKPQGRAEANCYLVEGDNLVHQALKSSSTRAVYAIPESAPHFREECLQKGVPLYVAGGGLMQKLVGTGYETAVTSLAIVAQHRLESETWAPPADALILACERIQDPRNAGVLIRTAEAAGCSAILFSSDCAEPWQRASVRSTTGSILRLPIGIVDDLPLHLKHLGQVEIRIIATSAKAPQLAYEADLKARPLIILVGNETEGLSEAAREAATDFVALPMAPNGASSLNVTVAAGVLLYEAVRQLRFSP